MTPTAAPHPAHDVGAHSPPLPLPAAGVLKRPAPLTPKQLKAATRARSKTERIARRAALGEQRRRAAPVIGASGLRGAAGGGAGVIDVPPEYRATTVQVCGLWPWAVGSGTPMIGTPIGHHLHTGATVCFDPLSWFLRAKLISNPSLFMLGLPGLGKSTFIRKLVTGATATGVVPMILGDLKPDYAEQIRQLGGQVVSVGRGRGYLNPLAVGALGSILPQLEGRASYGRVAAEVHARRLSMTSALVSLVRKEEITDTEQTVLATALRLLDEHAAATGNDTPPLLSDLVDVIKAAGPELMAVTLTDDTTEYKASVRRLHLSLIALMSGPVGEVFSQQTSVPLDLNAPAVCIDLSGIAATDDRLTAAVLLACWSDGFGAIEAAHTLADEGLAPQKFFFAVLDELWRVLRAGVGMVDRVDELTRLNRTLGLGQAMITHSLDDLNALASDADRAKARGFVERAGAVVCGGLPARELTSLAQIVGFTDVEQDMITAWSAPSTLSTNGEPLPPPGQGNFLIKIGSRTGIPLHIDLVEAERRSDVHNTNRRWDTTNIAAAVTSATTHDATHPPSPPRDGPDGEPLAPPTAATPPIELTEPSHDPEHPPLVAARPSADSPAAPAAQDWRDPESTTVIAAETIAAADRRHRQGPVLDPLTHHGQGQHDTDSQP
jgi:hypothetical protein